LYTKQQNRKHDPGHVSHLFTFIPSEIIFAGNTKQNYNAYTDWEMIKISLGEDLRHPFSAFLEGNLQV
jgi:hypothetical protein